MALNLGIQNYISATLISAFVLLGLAACGNSKQSKTGFLSYNPQILSANIAEEKAANVNFPDPDVVPQLKYTPIKSVFGNASDITQGEKTQEILLKLRAISSLTNAYHQELLEILESATVLDFPHLMLMADSCYFPAVTYDLMIDLLNNPSSCGNLTPELCQARLSQVKSNAKLAIDFGNFLNKILLEGRPKLTQLNTEQAFSLLKKSYPQLDSTNLLFKETLNELTDLSADQKILFMNLAIIKSAWNQASDLAFDWYKNDSDRSSESLILVANNFPLSEMRDELLIRAMDIISDLTGPQAKHLTQLALNPLKIAQMSLGKIHDLNTHDLSELVSIIQNPVEKDLLISSGISKLKSTSASDAVELIRQSNKNKSQTAQSLISLIPNFVASDLVLIAQNSSFDQDREQIILSNINRFATLSATDARLIADQSGRSTVRIVLMLLPKVNRLTGLDLAHIAESINSGPGRDEALLAGVKLALSSEVNGDIAVLKLAYNSKLEVTLALLSKTFPLVATDLALIANNCLNGSTRDQLLLRGSNFVSQASVEGVIAMVNQATQEKVNVATAVIPKILEASALDLGLILKAIADGPTRDRLIANGLSLIKRFDGNGAALIVDRSFDFKVDTATKLISLIPNASGTDLDKMLAVCGSGNTRDLILSNAIKLLGILTKQEAKSLYSRAYGNKETVAILLMSKVDNIDGQTIGEIALFSSKGSVRDLIISEGLKRLVKIDTLGLIAMITASDKLTEKLALEVSSRIENLNVINAIAISNVISNLILKDRFLVHSIDLIMALDEPSITLLALAAESQSAREEIVRKGVAKIGDSQ